MFLGIEIGGTKLQLGLGQGDGVLRALARAQIVPADGPEGIRRQIIEAVPRLLADARVTRDLLRGVGVGFGGPVDDANHEVIKSHQIAGWDHYPLAEWVASILQLPAWLANDSDAAGLAEALFGAGKELRPLYYLNIGSGIGGGFVQNGHVYRGTGRGAAETGHLRIACLEKGKLVYHTLEDLASGWAIERRTREAAQANPDRSTTLRRLEEDSSRWRTPLIAQAAAGGDPIAREVLDAALDALAEAICHVVALLCPRRIVLGGGVALLGEEAFLAPLRRRVAERVFTPFADCFDIVPAGLGEEVVVHGALAIARINSQIKTVQ